MKNALFTLTIFHYRIFGNAIQKQQITKGSPTGRTAYTMKATEFIDIYGMLDRIVNGGDNIKDFGVIDESGEIYATLESGEIYSFFIEKGANV